jgi:hypothetical protein
LLETLNCLERIPAGPVGWAKAATVLPVEADRMLTTDQVARVAWVVWASQ